MEYTPGTQLTLTPYQPYKPNARLALGRDERPVHVKPKKDLEDFDALLFVWSFDKAEIKVEKTLSDSGPRVLLCSVVKAPQTKTKKHDGFPTYPKMPRPLIVAKVFDRDYGDVEAEEALRCEAAVYRHLFKNKMTGHSHMAPEYYGSWATKIPKDDGGTRHVGVLLMEYVDGISMQRILATEDSAAADVRRKLTGVFLCGMARHAQIGIEHTRATPKDVVVVVTTRDERARLRTPRVVLLDYHRSLVTFATRACREGLDHGYVHAGKPPHPRLLFDVEKLEGMGFPRSVWGSAGFEKWSGKMFGRHVGVNERFYTLEEEVVEDAGWVIVEKGGF